MKRLLLFFCVGVLFTFTAFGSEAAFVSGSTGTDGALNPTANTVLQLPASGVFNFTSVNIPAGVTVTFTPNANNTPVMILATLDVTIAGTINVNGGSVMSTTTAIPGVGGPGGFAGGYGGNTGTAGVQGLGPGGGYPGPYSASGSFFCSGGGGGYGAVGSQYMSTTGAGGPAYGNVRINPLIGGSGGGGKGGSSSTAGNAGGGGGGAILIASSTSISITGSITAHGGDGYTYSGGGSGGAIKLMANSITSSGVITASGGGTGSNGVTGGAGRIRVEGYTVNITSGTDPAYTYGQPGSAIMSNMPSLSVTSIAGVNVPANPTGSFSQPDILLPNTTVNPVTVNVSAANIPVGTTVTITAIPKLGAETNVTTALSGTQTSSSASASLTVSTSYITVLMATATFTMQTSMYWEGEKIEKAIVRAIPGRASETTFVTETGRQVKASELIAKNVGVQQ